MPRELDTEVAPDVLEDEDAVRPAELGSAGYKPHPAYRDLDDGVQAVITPKEFAWLPDAERARFLGSIGEAEAFPDS